MPVVIDTKQCTGCKACELACSYHHQQIFKPGIASIHVHRHEVDGDFDVRLMIYRQTENGHLACDCSEGREFCIRYCPAIGRDELKALLQLKECE